VVTDTEKNSVTFTEKIDIIRPLQLIKKGSNSLLIVEDEEGKGLISDTYDHDYGAYRVQDIRLPVKVVFDAKNVVVTNP
jgi:hypothetical protein